MFEPVTIPLYVAAIFSVGSFVLATFITIVAASFFLSQLEDLRKRKDTKEQIKVLEEHHALREKLNDQVFASTKLVKAVESLRAAFNTNPSDTSCDVLKERHEHLFSLLEVLSFKDGYFTIKDNQDG